MTGVIDDIRLLLGPDDPAPAGPPDLSPLRFRVLERLDERLAEAEPGHIPLRAADRNRRHTTVRRLGVVAVTITVLAAAVVLARSTSTNELDQARTESLGPAVLELPLDRPAGAALLELADTAAARGLAPLAGHGYWYRSQARWDLYPEQDALATRMQLQLRELWRDSNGNRFETTAAGPMIDPGAAIQVSVDALPQVPPQQQALPLPTLHPDQPLLQPGGVEDAIAHVLSEGEEPFKSFFGALDIIQERVLPGDQLAEMYRLLARVDGVRYRGPVVDRAGRNGRAFTIARNDPADEPVITYELLLIVDPANGQPLGVETIIDHDTIRDITTPTVEWFTVFLQLGQVDQPRARPTY